MIHNQTNYDKYVETQRDYLQKWYPMMRALVENVPDLDILNQAMELTRRAEIFPMGLWPSLKRIRNQAHNRKLEIRSNARYEKAWDQDIEDMQEWADLMKEMSNHQRDLRQWNLDHYTNLLTRQKI